MSDALLEKDQYFLNGRLLTNLDHESPDAATNAQTVCINYTKQTRPAPLGSEPSPMRYVY